MSKNYRGVMDAFAKRLLNGAKSVSGYRIKADIPEGFEDEYSKYEMSRDAFILYWLTKQSDWNSDTTKKHVDYIISNGIDNGLNNVEIGDLISKTMTGDYSKQRANRTSATILQGASLKAMLIMASELNKRANISFKKTWITKDDEKVRLLHGLANNETVDLNKPFVMTGEKLMYPCDPNGQPANIINCRCVMIIVNS